MVAKSLTRTECARKVLTAEYVRSVLDYDPETGTFRWSKTLAGVRYFRGDLVGGSAGTINQHGYRVITVGKAKHPAAKLACLIVTGEWPIGEVDHKNTVRNDDRWDNLRPATPSQNVQNRNRPRNNTSGFKGVSWSASRKAWWAQITKDGIHHNLGLFATPEEAYTAYCEAAASLHGEFSRLR
jgi:hypothetical protein